MQDGCLSWPRCESEGPAMALRPHRQASRSGGVSACVSLWLMVQSALLGCASTTTIRASDPSAKIYVDGEYRGDGLVSHSDTKIVGASTSVKLQREGCVPAEYTFARNEELDVGALIGGLLVLVPFLWIQKYKSERTLAYDCVPTPVPTAVRATTAVPSAVRATSPEPVVEKDKTSWRRESGLFD